MRNLSFLKNFFTVCQRNDSHFQCITWAVALDGIKLQTMFVQRINILSVFTFVSCWLITVFYQVFFSCLILMCYRTVMLSFPVKKKNLFPALNDIFCLCFQVAVTLRSSAWIPLGTKPKEIERAKKLTGTSPGRSRMTRRRKMWQSRVDSSSETFLTPAQRKRLKSSFLNMVSKKEPAPAK